MCRSDGLNVVHSTRASLWRGDCIVIANPSTGFTLYSLETGGHDVRQERATPVKFIESGSAIVGGTTVGAVNIWDLETGRKVQTLLHGGVWPSLSCNSPPQAK